jgi:hypothetical protein
MAPWPSQLHLQRCTALPRWAANYQQLQQAIVQRGLLQQVRLLSISFDPRDTPAVLAQYSQRQHADPRLWRMVSVDRQPDREAALDAFGVVVLPAPMGDSHNAFLLDRGGFWSASWTTTIRKRRWRKRWHYLRGRNRSTAMSARLAAGTACLLAATVARHWLEAACCATCCCNCCCCGCRHAAGRRARFFRAPAWLRRGVRLDQHGLCGLTSLLWSLDDPSRTGAAPQRTTGQVRAKFASLMLSGAILPGSCNGPTR